MKQCLVQGGHGNVSLKMFFSKCSVFSTAVNLCCSSPNKVSVRIVCFLHVQRWVLFSSKVLHGQGPFKWVSHAG